jgi:hypothetical protein
MMSTKMQIAIRWLGGTAMLALAALGGGCTHHAQLWANSDSDDPKSYSTASPQHVHVGETVQFRVTIEPDDIDYIVLDFDGELDLPSKVVNGQYAFTKQIPQSWRGRTVTVTARVYRKFGKPDYYEQQGRLVYRAAKYDDADQVLATSSLAIACYQTTVDITIAGQRSRAPNLDQAYLLIYGPDGKVTRVNKSLPGQHGFVVLGPLAMSSNYAVHYEPKWDEVRRSGKTRVVLKSATSGGGSETLGEMWIVTR